MGAVLTGLRRDRLHTSKYIIFFIIVFLYCVYNLLVFGVRMLSRPLPLWFLRRAHISRSRDANVIKAGAVVGGSALSRVLGQALKEEVDGPCESRPTLRIGAMTGEHSDQDTIG